MTFIPGAFTPGPWQISHIAGQYDLMIGGGEDGSFIIADIRGRIKGAPNACLIATAPDLLHIAQRAATFLGDDGNFSPEPIMAGGSWRSYLLDEINAIIAKATQA